MAEAAKATEKDVFQHPYLQKVPVDDRNRFANYLENNKKNHKNDEDTNLLMMYIMYSDRADLNIIKKIVNENPEQGVKTQNKYGISPLIAAGNNPTTSFEVFKYLIDEGANVNDKDRFEQNALKRHLQYKDINEDVVKLILSKGFDATTLDKRERNRITKLLNEAQSKVSPDGPKYEWKNPHGVSITDYWCCLCLDTE